MADHLSDRSRDAIAAAGHEARELGHASVGDGHLLLGLLHARRGVAARTLERHGVTLRTTRALLASMRPREHAGEVHPVRLDLSAQRASHLALHEAFARNDGPIRASYKLIGTLGADGDAARLVAAQGVAPAELIAALARKLPPPDPQRGIELLVERLTIADAYLAAWRRRDDVARIVAGAPDRDTAAHDIAALLALTEANATAVAEMRLDLGTREGIEALETERRDLYRRLSAKAA